MLFISRSCNPKPAATKISGATSMVCPAAVSPMHSAQDMEEMAAGCISTSGTGGYTIDLEVEDVDV